MTPTQYKAAMVALFGSERRHNQLSDLLGISPHTSRGYGSGAREIPLYVENHIGLLLGLKQLTYNTFKGGGDDDAA